MSRELLKRVITECSDEGRRSNISTDLYCAIAEYLEMPEPEPVASINGWYGGYPTVCSINGAVLPVGMALYPHAPARLPLQTPHTTQIDQSARIAELEKQLEIERMRLAGCGVAAMSNTDESVKARINNLSPFWSASYGDVCAAVDREMSLRKQLADQSAQIAVLKHELLTEMAQQANNVTNPYYEFARAIEAAHGIGVNHE